MNSKPREYDARSAVQFYHNTLTFRKSILARSLVMHTHTHTSLHSICPVFSPEVDAEVIHVTSGEEIPQGRHGQGGDGRLNQETVQQPANRHRALVNHRIYEVSTKELLCVSSARQ